MDEENEVDGSIEQETALEDEEEILDQSGASGSVDEHGPGASTEEKEEVDALVLAETAEEAKKRAEVIKATNIYRYMIAFTSKIGHLQQTVESLPTDKKEKA